jgi:hypothetical protein
MPDRRVAVFSRALGVESIGLCNTSALMVSSDEMNSVGVSELETYEETDGLNTEESTIHIVTCSPCQPSSDNVPPSLSCMPCFPCSRDLPKKR